MLLKKEINKNIEFINYFYDIKLNKKHRIYLYQYLKSIDLYSKGIKINQISEIINRPKRTIENWLSNKSLPYSVWFLKYFINLGKPENKKFKWVSINSTKGGIFIGPWILVPKEIKNYKDILFVINQIKPLSRKNNSYNLDKRIFLFAYLLGLCIGDASKDRIIRENRTTRRITLRLTKKYKSNENLGQIFCECLNNIGLKVNKIKDDKPSRKNKYYFYRWNGQCSPLIQWVFKSCLGLKNFETTTYNSIKTEWILKTPKKFRIYLLQGIADSDGYVDFSSFRAGITTKPNAKLIKKIFNSLNIKSCILNINNMFSVTININDAWNLPLFNEYKPSYRYIQTKILANSNRLKGPCEKYINEKIINYIKKGLKVTQIIKKILEEENIAIRPKAIRKRMNQLKEKGHITCLGIESTAQ